MPAGRPSKYEEGMIERAQEYIYGGFAEREDMIPHVEGLAEVLEVCSKTLYNWGAKHEEFLLILDALQDRQRRELINKGLSGDFNSNITKLVLGKHGYHDKVDGTIGNPDGTALEWSLQPVAADPSRRKTATDSHHAEEA